MIRKSDFFCKIYRHVRHTLILICTLMSSIGKIYQKFEKMFRKIIISPICNRGQIYMLMYYRENKKKFWKFSQQVIQFWKLKFTLTLLIGEIDNFLQKITKFHSISPIVEKSIFFFQTPPSTIGKSFCFFFSKKTIINGENL